MGSGHPEVSQEELFSVLFPVEKSIRYHRRRRAFYDSWHRWLMLGVILAGSASVADVIPSYPKVLGLIIALFGASDLVFGLSDKARDHDFLMRRFCHLMADMRSCSEPTRAHVDRWQVERIQIEADEPATYWALEAACFNEATRAFDRNRDDEVHLAWYYRLTKNYFQYDPTRFKAVGQ